MTDKDNSQTGEYSYTYSYSYSKEGGEKNVEVHTGGFSAATAGEAAVDSTGKTTAGESSSGKSATGKTTTIKSTTGKTTTRSRSTTTSSRSSTSSRSKNDNSGPDVGYWIMTAIFFATGLWPVGLIMLISKLSDPQAAKDCRQDRIHHDQEGQCRHPEGHPDAPIFRQERQMDEDRRYSADHRGCRGVLQRRGG